MKEHPRVVRSLLLAVLILVAPLPIDELVDEEEYTGREVILEIPNNQVWSQQDWENLEDYGYRPLRLLNPSTLIAWKSDVNAQHPTALEYNAEKAVWKSEPHEGQYVRVVFEPGLSESILQEVHGQLQDVLNSPLQSISHGHLASVDIEWSSEYRMEWLEEIEGILWVEPERSAMGRNLESAKLLSGLHDGSYPAAWTFGLNGTGVVLGVADTGIDSDHSCFRDITNSSIGQDHRKLMLVNTTIDEWDSAGHSDYRHGTHTAGILGCHPYLTATQDNIPPTIMSLGYDTKLVVQDIVSEEGWLPPDVDLLLAESAMYGGYLHSNSWGDDTTDYTLRSSDFDAFTREFPWTLPLIAPGNNGGLVLEPANARNVVAIGASTKDAVPERWQSSVHGQTDAETRGIFALAPGVSIVSARSDGSPDSYNAGQHTSSGTSMSTPMAATYASIIQQMVQEGWLTGHNETLTEHDLQGRVPWFEPDIPQGSILLGEGFVPSAPLMKSLLSLSTSPLGPEQRNGGNGGSTAPNEYDGWGVMNLSELIDFENLEMMSLEVERPVPNVWIHDSYRLAEQLPSDMIVGRQGGATPIEYLMENAWDGQGAVGPFLSTGDVFQQRFILQEGEALNVQLSIQAKPEPHLVDDVQLMVRLPDGRFAVGEDYRQDGRSMLYYDFADNLNTSAFPSTNETTVGIHLDEEALNGIDYVDVLVIGRYITPGNLPGTLGVEGDHVGFGLAVQGVELDPLNHSDGDDDGVPYALDLCPFTNAYGWDLNGDGCIDDNDQDGVGDDMDDCLMTLVGVPVTEAGCAQQNQSPRIFVDESLLFNHDNETITILYSIIDEDLVNTTVSLERVGSDTGTVDVCMSIVQNDSWASCSVNVSQDFFPLNAGGNWTVNIIARDLNSSWWASPATTNYESEVFTIYFQQPVSYVHSDSDSIFATIILSSIAAAVVLALVLQLWFTRATKK